MNPEATAQHSHSLEGWYVHIPGLKVVTPATLEDGHSMLWTALDAPNPVLIFEQATLYGLAGELAALPQAKTIVAAIKRMVRSHG